MTAYQHGPRLHHSENTPPDPGGDWRNALLAACVTVIALGALAGIYQLAGWVRGLF